MGGENEAAVGPGPATAPTVIDVPVAVACGVHDYLGGGNAEAAALVERTRALRASGPVEWRVPVDARTIHRIVALHALAGAEGVSVCFEPDAALTERERAFFDDFRRQRVDATLGRLRRGRVREWLSGLHEALDALVRSLQPGPATALAGRSLRSVVVIGAYGGDHIGDAAILGGVLLGLGARHGVTQATVLSHRAEHTRRLVAMLALPMRVAVEDYRPGAVPRLLDTADALVLAGGPVVDLPRVLAKHLASAHAARVRGKPFLIERVGPGEFHHALSARVARRTFELARSVTVRSASAATHPLLHGLAVGVGRDPAFDYLATRVALDRMAPGEREGIDALVAKTAGTRRIGINLRPVSDDWHPRGCEHARALRGRFLDRFCAGLAALAVQSPLPVTYVFFPMNAIQFGMSDLTAAYELHRRLGDRVRLVVFEADPTIDGVLRLLRSLDAAVVMRLHAAIFCLSQRVPVVGVDFFPDRNSKLTQLFVDEGRGERVTSMDAFDAGWLCDALASSLLPIAAVRDASSTAGGELPAAR